MKDLVKKILIADDDANHRKFLRGLLEKSNVDEVATANDLINKAREREYSLIITDYDMQEKRGSHGEIVYPDQTGLYAIEKIREFNKETPIIMNSSCTNLTIAFGALQKGADEFIPKKSSVDEFNRVIGKYLNKYKGGKK